MAEQRSPSSGDTSAAQERRSQGRDTTQEVGAQLTATARHVGETASQYYAHGRQQLAGFEPSLEENIRVKPCNQSWWLRGLGSFWDYSGGNSWRRCYASGGRDRQWSYRVQSASHARARGVVHFIEGFFSES